MGKRSRRSASSPGAHRASRGGLGRPDSGGLDDSRVGRSRGCVSGIHDACVIDYLDLAAEIGAGTGGLGRVGRRRRGHKGEDGGGGEPEAAATERS